jgi:hypothetical protein
MQYTQQSRPPRRASISPWVIMAGAAAVGAAAFLAMIAGLVVLYLSVERVPQGVTVAGLMRVARKRVPDQRHDAQFCQRAP